MWRCSCRYKLTVLTCTHTHTHTHTHTLLQVTTTLVSMSDTVMVDTNVDAVLRPLTEKEREVQEEMLFKPRTPAELGVLCSQWINYPLLIIALNITSNDIIITFITSYTYFCQKVLQLAIRCRFLSMVLVEVGVIRADWKSLPSKVNTRKYTPTSWKLKFV